MHYYLAPSTPPLNLTVTTVNNSAIKAEWNAPNLIHQNGILTEYQIDYYKMDESTPNISINLLADTHSKVITNLDINVNYCVTIRVATIAGFSTTSSPVCATTHEPGKLQILIEIVDVYYSTPSLIRTALCQ